MDEYNNNAPQQPQQATPVQATPADVPTPTSVMVFGIISLALSWCCGCNIAGLILGIIGMKKAKAYMESGAPYSTQVKVGKILATVGFIVSIVTIALYVIIFTCAGCAACISANSGNYSSYY